MGISISYIISIKLDVKGKNLDGFDEMRRSVYLLGYNHESNQGVKA